MRDFFRKIQVALMFSLITSMGYAYGQHDNALLCGQRENCCPCETTCWGTGFISADLLYWRAFQGGLDNCFPTENSEYISSYGGDIVTKFRGKGKDPHFNWDPGFRLGAGYEFVNGFDLAVYWTHFHSRSNRQDNQHQQHWKLDFNVVDIVGGYAFDIGSCFKLRPFGGIRGAKIEQKLHTQLVSNGISADSYFDSYADSYFGPDLNFLRSSSGSTLASTSSKNKLLGIGPLVGVEGDWKMGCGFSLYANTSFAILYGNFHTRFDESNEFLDGGNFSHIKRRSHACQAVVDVGFGIRWQTICFCDKMVWLQLGLEHHRYFNQNRFGNYGDLCLDGVNFGAGIAF